MQRSLRLLAARLVPGGLRGISGNSSAISRPASRTSLVTAAALRRVASNSTRRVRAPRSKPMPDAVDVADAGQRKATCSVGGVV